MSKINNNNSLNILNIPAKKSLGQNFLKSPKALNKMLEAGEINNEDIILEIGPGKGILTEKLLKKAGKVVVVEKDNRLIPFLQEKFFEEIKKEKLKIISGDILDLEFNHLFLSEKKEKKIKYKIIANIPYYITGQFLRKFLESTNQPEKIVIMIQKEIAQRIVAQNNKQSLLSISIKAFGLPKMIMKVEKKYFSPAPKVDSAILLISDISKDFFIKNKIEEKTFFKLIHNGFAHKRKIIISNLKKSNKGKDLTLIFEESKIPLKARAEDLTLTDWKNLYQKLVF